MKFESVVVYEVIGSPVLIDEESSFGIYESYDIALEGISETHF